MLSCLTGKYVSLPTRVRQHFSYFWTQFAVVKSSKTLENTGLFELGEVLDGADHLAGVAVLVVIPSNNLHLIGMQAAKRLAIRVFRLFALKFSRLFRLSSFRIIVVPNFKQFIGLQMEFIIPFYTGQAFYIIIILASFIIRISCSLSLTSLSSVLQLNSDQ